MFMTLNLIRFFIFGLALCVALVEAAPAPRPTQAILDQAQPNLSSATNSTSTATSASASSSASTTPSKSSAVCGKPGQGKVHHDETKNTHPDPKNKVTLWKAIKDDDGKVKRLKAEPKIKYDGDFRKGFYMTDTKESAAQLACHIGGHKQSVAVFEYIWDPQDTTTFEFAGKNQLWKSFVMNHKEERLRKNDIIAGPLRDKKDISTNVWQYVITNKNALKHLKVKEVHRKVMCKDVPKGDLC